MGFFHVGVIIDHAIIKCASWNLYFYKEVHIECNEVMKCNYILGGEVMAFTELYFFQYVNCYMLFPDDKIVLVICILVQ